MIDFGNIDYTSEIISKCIEKEGDINLQIISQMIENIEHQQMKHIGSLNQFEPDFEKAYQLCK